MQTGDTLPNEPISHGFESPSPQHVPGEIEQLSWPRNRAVVRMALARDRAAVFVALLSVDDALVNEPHPDGSSVLGIMASCALSERRIAAILLQALERRGGALPAESPEDEQETEVTASLGLESTIALYVDSRRLLLDIIAGLSDDELFGDSQLISLLPVSETGGATLDRRLADSIHRIVEQRGITSRLDSIIVFEAAMRAVRKDLLTVVALLPEAERPSWRVTRAETLLDGIRAVQGRERTCLGLLIPEAMPSPLGPDSSWNVAWQGLHRGHQALLRAVGKTDQATLAQPVSHGEGTIYSAFADLVREEHHLARALRSSIALPSAHD